MGAHEQRLGVAVADAAEARVAAEVREVPLKLRPKGRILDVYKRQEKAVGVLRDYGVQMEVRVLSAHRCPNEAREFAASAREGGFSVILAFAGMAAHLAGAMAANTCLLYTSIRSFRRQ